LLLNFLLCLTFVALSNLRYHLPPRYIFTRLARATPTPELIVLPTFVAATTAENE
jgi:hypothetical protein